MVPNFPFALSCLRNTSMNRRDAEARAQRLRQEWGVGNAPVSDIFGLIAGRPDYVIVRHRGALNGIDGMYAFDAVAGKHFIYVNRSKPLARQRFTAAHELGHAIQGPEEHIDRDIFSDNGQDEAIANYFAAEFLLPIEALKRWVDTHGEITHAEVARIASRYKLSMNATIYKLHNSGFLSDADRDAWINQPPPVGTFQRQLDANTSDYDELPTDYVEGVKRQYSNGLLTMDVALDALALHPDDANWALPQRTVKSRRRRNAVDLTT